MAQLSTLVNTLDCSESGTLGTGLAHCLFDFDNMSGGGIGLLKPRTDLSAISGMDGLRTLQKDGKLEVLQGIFNVEPLSAEDQFETAASGTESLATKGLFKYRVDFVNGHMFHKALASLEGNRRWEVIKWDAAGNLDVRQTTSGEVRGYSTSHVTVGLPTMKNGGTTAKQSLVFQESKRSERDNQISYINWDQLDADGISFLELEGVNQLKVTIDPASDGDGIITGKIVSANDGKLTYSGLEASDIVITNTDLDSFSINDKGDYTITLTTGAELIGTQTVSVSINGVVESAEGQLFKSNTATITVAA